MTGSYLPGQRQTATQQDTLDALARRIGQGRKKRHILAKATDRRRLGRLPDLQR